MNRIAITILLAVLADCGGGSIPLGSDADFASTPDPSFESAEPDPAGTEASEALDAPSDARDLAPEVACGEPPFDPHCPCASNSDCSTGYCIATSEGHRCARSCTEGSECGPLEVCAQVATYPDLLYLCVELYPTLCRPCKADVDCRVDFAPAQPKCAALGDPALGLFCQAPCSSSGTCPAGYSCSPCDS